MDKLTVYENADFEHAVQKCVSRIKSELKPYLSDNVSTIISGGNYEKGIVNEHGRSEEPI